MPLSSDSKYFSPGKYMLDLKLSNETVLRYGLIVPKLISKTTNFHIILALHYGGKITPYYGYDFMTHLIEPAFDKFEGIIVAPDCPKIDWKSPESIQAIIELLKHLQYKYHSGNERVIIIGFSMGAVGGWHLLVEHPDLFSAAILIAGSPIGIELDKIPSIPIYIIHGSSDEFFPIKKVKNAHEFLLKKGIPVKLKVLFNISHYSVNLYIPALRSTKRWLKDVIAYSKNRNAVKSF